jgi:hypothetical protein
LRDCLPEISCPQADPRPCRRKYPRCAIRPRNHIIGAAATTGSDTFIFAPDYDYDKIWDFESGKDTIAVLGFEGIDNFAGLSAYIDEANGNSVIDISDQGTTIVVLGVIGLTGSVFDFG